LHAAELSEWRTELIWRSIAKHADKFFADKPTRGQSTRGLDNSQSSQLADGEFLKGHEITILYLYIKPNPSPNSNPIEYWQCINSIICPK